MVVPLPIPLPGLYRNHRRTLCTDLELTPKILQLKIDYRWTSNVHKPIKKNTIEDSVELCTDGRSSSNSLSC